MGNELDKLLPVLQEARALLARTENDFSWSGWKDSSDALAEIDRLISEVKKGKTPPASDLDVLFAPTGAIQEVSLSSGWGKEFLALADRFDRVTLLRPEELVGSRHGSERVPVLLTLGAVFCLFGATTYGPTLLRNKAGDPDYQRFAWEALHAYAPFVIGICLIIWGVTAYIVERKRRARP